MYFVRSFLNLGMLYNSLSLSLKKFKKFCLVIDMFEFIDYMEKIFLLYIVKLDIYV